MIINIENFNMNNSLLYRIMDKINPSRFRRAAAYLALSALLVLPGCSLLEPAKEPPKPANPTGVSALDYLDEALKLEPDYAQALIRRGLALSQLGYADEAFDDLTRAIRIEPSAEAYLSRAICLLQQGNTVGARKDLDESLRLDDASYRVWNILGAVALKEDKDQEACDAFEKACSNGDCTAIDAARREKICQ